MKKKIAIGVIAGIVVVSLIGAVVAWRGTLDEKGRFRSAKGGEVALVRVEGVIIGGRGEVGLLGSTSGSEAVIARLREVEKDPSLKALVLRVNSPGGSAAASQEIGEAVKRVKATGKPVVVSMGDAAASGGYWISAAADKIVANPATMTGSIGVIMETTNLVGLYGKVGVKREAIKSGPFKDIGSPSREMTPEEKAILQGMIDDIYEQFVRVVADGRKLDPGVVRQFADGRVFTGSQAVKIGLVDELGDLNQAVKLAGKLAGIKGEPRVREIERRRTALDVLLSGGIGSSWIGEAVTWLNLSRGVIWQDSTQAPELLRSGLEPPR
ncbi:MAG: signal peptide peptidase SppA [Actinobacteria bacterium]|nr:signal peptide peptidase SppA [Actinomycetota bacterium]